VILSSSKVVGTLTTTVGGLTMAQRQFVQKVEQPNHILLQYARGKVAVGKASRLSSFPCLSHASGRPHLVRFSLFGFGLSKN
jgi:hypothetical protein